MLSRSRFLVVLSTAALACSDPTGGDTPNATLAFSPSSITLAESEPTAQLFLTTTPSGGRLSWQVARKPAWLTVSPAEGVVSGIVSVTLSATVSQNQEPGQVFGGLEIVSSGGVIVVPVTLTVAATPKLALSATSLAIAATVDTQTIMVRNTGRGFLQWSATASASWIKTIPEEGFVPTRDSVLVKVVPNRDPLPAGDNAGTVTFTSNGTPSSTILPVMVSVAPAPRAMMRLSRLVFVGSETRSFYLINPGKGTLDWSVSAKDNWLTTSPASGSVPASDSIRIDVTANAAAAPAPPASGSVTIASNSVDGTPLRLNADLIGSAPALGVSHLDHDVVDAEYSIASGLLLIVSSSPNRLFVYDLEVGGSWSVDLPLAGCCVSVRPDGRFAVVAHDGLLTYVDLVSRQIVQSFPTTTDAIDVVLASNGWAYVFPRTDQWVEIHGINLTTGAESNGSTIFAGTRAKLHPAGAFMYGVWFLSPADIEKYDIRAGRPTHAGDSPYHGDYPIGYNLWMSQDGSRILTETGRIFRTSSVASEDMQYVGRLFGIEAARGIADSPTRGRIYALGTPTQIQHLGVPPEVRTPEVRSYDASNLLDRGALTLPKISLNGQEADADGHHVFADSRGGRVYVLLKGVPSSALANLWALLTVDASTIP
jgi:hypothetical protein